MHWTAFLAYRRVPANAQVIGDLGCIHCGYNVRGLRASGLCPECGSRIAESLTLLAKPDVVAQSLRSFSNSFFALLITVIGCVGGMAGWQAIVTSAVLAASALNRSWNASELKFRAQLGNSEKLMSRATVLWWITLVETLIALGWFAGVLATVYVPSLQTAASANFVMNIAALWLVAMLGSAAAAGWLGAALASILGYGWMAIEFQVQIIAVAITVATAVLFSFARAMPLSAAAAVSMACVTGLALLASVALTWVALQHAANAAEQERGDLDDLSDKIAVVQSDPPDFDPPARRVPIAPQKPANQAPNVKPQARPDRNQQR